jgi:putative nucleotidyltransferase with HDIG domain
VVVNTIEVSPASLTAGIKDLVTLPDVALRIARMVEDPTSSASDIGREISNDAALTARLLRIANSAAYGQSRQIATLSRAITILGVRQVRDLTVGLTAIRAFDGISNDLVTMEVFWRHSVLCAVAAGQIAARRGAARAESPFVAGLLHDIGQLVLFSRAPAAAREALLMMADATDDIGLNECERSVLGFDHTTVGAELARSWQLPSSLQECILYHHEPHLAKSHAVDVATVHIANSIAVLAEINSEDIIDAPTLDAGALQRLSLDAKALPELVRQTRAVAAEITPQLLAA